MCADKSKGIRKTLEVPEEEQDDIEDDSPNGTCTCTCNYRPGVVDQPLALYSGVPSSVPGSSSLSGETQAWPRAAVGGVLNIISFIHSRVHCEVTDSNALAIVTICVAPITQVTHWRNKNSNIQGKSPIVAKVIFLTKRNCS